MAPPKKRVRVVNSDDDDEEQQQPQDQPLKAQDTASKATSTRKSARLSSKPSKPQPTVPVDDGDDDSEPQYIETIGTSSIAKTAALKPSARRAAATTKSPSKSPSKSVTLKAQKPNASIKSFFNSSQAGQLPLGSQKSEARVTKKTSKKAASISSGLDRLILSQGSSASVPAGLNEQIEDSSEDDRDRDIKDVTLRQTGTQHSNQKVNSSKIRSPEESSSSLPWPERYAPRTVNDLAVNKTKIAQVRGWLEQVLYGHSSKRLLVLKGPAGAGKTATVECLSKELGYEILEWRNPSSNASTGDDAGFSSFSSMFEDFLARAGKWNSLDIVTTRTENLSNVPSLPPPREMKAPDPNTKKLILIEDFPNMLVPSSSPLLAFQHSVKSFLALPPENNPSPLVMIITETPNFTGSSALTAHRLLGPSILHHHRTTEIEFRPIAKKFMTKALEDVLMRENRENRRIWGPSKMILDKIGSIGDIRSALASLEFLSISGEDDVWKGEVRLGTKAKRKQAADDISERHLKLLQAIPSRESHLNLFHAIGKVVYNKRYGDDPADPYHAPPARPSLPHHPYHRRALKSTPESILEELTTEMPLFISSLHQNYLLSCRTSDELNGCIDALSDADMLLPSNSYEEGALRKEEIAFDVAVRGLFLSLPSPVQRRPSDHGLTYPLSARLWKKTEENEGLLASIAAGLSNEDVLPGTHLPTTTTLCMELVPYASKIMAKKYSHSTRSASSIRIAMRKFLLLGNLPRNSDDPESDVEVEEVLSLGGAGKRREGPFGGVRAHIPVVAETSGENMQAGRELSDDQIGDFSD